MTLKKQPPSVCCAIAVVAVIIGLVIGWYVGTFYREAEELRDVKETIESIEALRPLSDIESAVITYQMRKLEQFYEKRDGS